MRCPACERGVVNEDTRICCRCGVAIARGSTERTNGLMSNERWHPPDQDRVGPYTDYVRHKQDHQE